MSSALSGILNAMAVVGGAASSLTSINRGIRSAAAVRDNPQLLYALLEALYANNDLYSEVNRQLAGSDLAGSPIQGLRNPTAAVCTFHELTMWPGTLPDALPIETPERRTIKRNRRLSLPNAPTTAEQSDRLEAAIERGWWMSNWGRQKEPFALNLAKLGDQFLKVASDKDRGRAWFEIISPVNVTDFDIDERGYLTYIRLDFARTERDADGTARTIMTTEVWDMSTGRYRIWRRDRQLWTVGDPDLLGEPTEERDMAEFGVDYVPVVHAMFHDDASDRRVARRGTAAIMPALDKIIYGDMLDTALHQRLVNHNIPDKVLEGTGRDANGMPLAPPSLSDGGDTVSVNGVTMWRLPSGWTLRDSVAVLDYAAHLSVVEGHYSALRQSDLPQMTYYTVSEAGGDVSGKAINYKLKPAITLAELIRGNGEAALVQANMMLLSAGQHLELPGFREREIGTYRNGDFAHWFTPRNIVPLSTQEEAEVMQIRANTIKALTDSGSSLRGAAEAAGLDAEQVDALLMSDTEGVPVQ